MSYLRLQSHKDAVRGQVYLVNEREELGVAWDLVPAPMSFQESQPQTPEFGRSSRLAPFVLLISLRHKELNATVGDA